MAYVLQKGAEEVTERALVPYVVQPIVESGFSTMLVKWLPWSGVAIHSAGIYKEISYGLTYSGGVTLPLGIVITFDPIKYHKPERSLGLQWKFKNA